ncbi:uncharacterized protein KIAA1614 homolog isoform X1 [Pelobates fuscus]|uniref:uncharacterized protein KIAA1614 homolog isoform X1 n=2 Tax=Pelobates fuscus TaxID=191477 RepID=UPI002FE49ED1
MDVLVLNLHYFQGPNTWRQREAPGILSCFLCHSGFPWILAKMAAEVNMRECLAQIDKEKRRTSRVNKSPRKGKPSSGGSGSIEDVGKSGVAQTEVVAKTSVLQGKIKALKEKHKELKTKECSKEEGDLAEDVLVVPQLRTYLTEDALGNSSPGRSVNTGQENLGSEKDWGDCRIDGAEHKYNGHLAMSFSDMNLNTNEMNSQIWPEDRLPSSFQEKLGPSQYTNNLSLAERVERNRQDLRSKFIKATCYDVAALHGDGDDQIHLSNDPWIFLGNVDGDSGVSLPVSESCRELSVRHEQAKQLLHRARMKAKGASPLRASHCVISHPNSQPPLRRTACISCTTTDGGSLSDSSSSDYCSWQRGSRGSSPSHVRFQDESEWDAEERYRERQQQSPQALCVNTTPPVKRHSNGHGSWTQNLVPSVNEQCGACGSYPNGSGVSHIAGGTCHGSTPRNVQLGPRITQEGPLSSITGTRPSPHWILPSQPWRIHSELIRETHIGGDSTADSSGEDEGSRSQSKNSPSCTIRQNFRNKPHNLLPKPGTTTNSSNPEIETSSNVPGAKIPSESKPSLQKSIIDPRAKHYPPPINPNSKAKIPESNLETQSIPRACQLDAVIKSRNQPVPRNVNTKTAMRTVELRKELNPDIGTGDILLNLEIREGTKKLSPTDGKPQTASTVPCMKQIIPPLDVDSVEGSRSFSGHVPVPPAGRAPMTVPSRNTRFTMRPEETVPREASLVEMHNKNNVKHNPLPKSLRKNVDALGDDQPVSQTGTKTKDSKTRERSHKSRKQVDNEKSNSVKEHRIHNRNHVPTELAEREQTHITKRQSDRERPQIIREQADVKDDTNRTMVGSSRQQQISDRHHTTREEKCTESRGTVKQHSVNNTNKGDNIFRSTSQDDFTHEKQLVHEPGNERGPNVPVMPLNPLPSPVKKSDIRSGMRKLFSTFGLTSRPRLDRFQSSSLEQISHAAVHNRDGDGDGESETGSVAMKPSRIKKSPSLQSLKLMSPFHLPRKSSSVQNLLGKSDRSIVYVTGDGNTAPRRALSVEDIGSPDMPRAVGRVSEVYPDGTRLLELQRPPQGSFGFTISSGNGRPDSGIYVQEMIDANTAKLYSGLLRVGDEILELNGTKVSTLGHARLNEIMGREPILSLRVLHQRRTKC